MFKKEAEEFKERTQKQFLEMQRNGGNPSLWANLDNIWKDGAEFGYNKANEWHYVKDGDLPAEDLRQRTSGYYLTASRHKSYKGFVFEVAYFTGSIFIKDGILDNVVAWKEITLPKETENA